MKTCPDCNGDGVIEKGTDDEQQCPTCGGRGFVPDDDDGQEEVINTQGIRLDDAADVLVAVEHVVVVGIPRADGAVGRSAFEGEHWSGKTA
jgi:RecJ-like exonuclease